MKLRWAVPACALLVLALSAWQHAAVPLYDGVALPDEAYRYVNPPAGKSTKLLPSSDTESARAADGFNKDGLYVTTNEQGPQAYISFSQHSLSVGPATSQITVQLKPLAAGTLKTAIGTIAGNVYRATASSDAGDVSYVSNKVAPSYVDMRLPQGYAIGASMIYRPAAAAAWQSIATARVGADIYEAKVVGLGDYALVAKPQAKPAGSKLKLLVIPLGIVVIVVALVSLLTRRTAAQKRQQPGPH